MPGLAVDDVELLVGLARGALLEEVDGGDDRRERIAELVAEQGEQIVLGLAEQPRLLGQLDSRDERSEVLPCVMTEPHVSIDVGACHPREAERAERSARRLEGYAERTGLQSGRRAGLEHGVEQPGLVREELDGLDAAHCVRRVRAEPVRPAVAVDERDGAPVEVEHPAESADGDPEECLEVGGIGALREELDEDVESRDVGGAGHQKCENISSGGMPVASAIVFAYTASAAIAMISMISDCPSP